MEAPFISDEALRLDSAIRDAKEKALIHIGADGPVQLFSILQYVRFHSQFEADITLELIACVIAELFAAGKLKRYDPGFSQHIAYELATR